LEARIRFRAQQAHGLLYVGPGDRYPARRQCVELLQRTRSRRYRRGLSGDTQLSASLGHPHPRGFADEMEVSTELAGDFAKAICIVEIQKLFEDEGSSPDGLGCRKRMTCSL